MALGNADVQVTAGYTQNVVGFGWTNGVYLKMRELLRAEAPGGPCATRQPAPAVGARRGRRWT
jgi:alpha,alpha-trehalase